MQLNNNNQNSRQEKLNQSNIKDIPTDPRIVFRLNK